MNIHDKFVSHDYFTEKQNVYGTFMIISKDRRNIFRIRIEARAICWTEPGVEAARFRGEATADMSRSGAA